MAATRGGLREGDVLAGKYRVERVLGSGGMGVVVAAHHLGLDARVAIKLLLPDLVTQEQVVARFSREARAAARIANDHVARVFDVGTLEDGVPYMVMEFLEGGDLSDRLHRRGPLPLEQAVDFVLQACEAVAEAHRAGVVHRDLKPANLFCVERPDGSLFIKVLDFGISKVAGGTNAGLAMTSTAAIMGTPFYMSPEQMDSARVVDERTDIWALGVVMFELLTGHRPFGGQTLPEVCVNIATRPVPPIRPLRPDVPSGLEAVILKCLEKNRSDRFASVSDLVAALAPFAAERGASSGGPSRRVVTLPSDLGTTAAAPESLLLGSSSSPSLSALGHTKATSGSRTPALLVVTGSALALVGLVAVIGVMSRSSSPVSTAPPPAVGLSAPMAAADAIAPAPVPAAAPEDSRTEEPRRPPRLDPTGPIDTPREAAAPARHKTPAALGGSKDAHPAIDPHGAGTTSPFDERL